MKLSFLVFVTAFLGASIFVHAETSIEPIVRTYRLRQNVTLSDIPSGAKTVKWWISIPDDDRDQDVLDFFVTEAPGPWHVVTEPEHGNRFMVVEVTAPSTKSLVTTVEVTLRRRSIFGALGP